MSWAVLRNSPLPWPEFFHICPSFHIWPLSNSPNFLKMGEIAWIFLNLCLSWEYLYLHPRQQQSSPIWFFYSRCFANSWFRCFGNSDVTLLLWLTFYSLNGKSHIHSNLLLLFFPLPEISYHKKLFFLFVLFRSACLDHSCLSSDTLSYKRISLTICEMITKLPHINFNSQYSAYYFCNMYHYLSLSICFLNIYIYYIYIKIYI